MFVTRSRFEREIADLRDDLRDFRGRYWKLQEAHDRLLAHLGLTEVEERPRTLLVQKGGPERSAS